MVQFTSNLAAPGPPLGHFWEHTVGSGHAGVPPRAVPRHLEADAVLSRSPFPATLEGGTLRLEVALPPHEVTAIAVER